MAIEAAPSKCMYMVLINVEVAGGSGACIIKRGRTELIVSDVIKKDRDWFISAMLRDFKIWRGKKGNNISFKFVDDVKSHMFKQRIREGRKNGNREKASIYRGVEAKFM